MSSGEGVGCYGHKLQFRCCCHHKHYSVMLYHWTLCAWFVNWRHWFPFVMNIFFILINTFQHLFLFIRCIFSQCFHPTHSEPKTKGSNDLIFPLLESSQERKSWKQMDHELKKENSSDLQLWMLQTYLYKSFRVSSFPIWQTWNKVVKNSVSVDSLAHLTCIQAAAAIVSSFSETITDIICSLILLHSI